LDCKWQLFWEKHRRHPREITTSFSSPSKSQLDNERGSFKVHWTDLSDYILPRRSRFTLTDSNRGDKKNQKIIDSTATLSVRTLKSGMMSGLTSPARPWFRLTISDSELSEVEGVKEWLSTITKKMADLYIRTNLYKELPTVYGDIGVFATGALFVEEDFEKVLRFLAFPIGSYWISNNAKLQVDTFYREFRMTVRQIVEKFGEFDSDGKVTNWEDFSTHVKDMYLLDEHREAWIDVCHVVSPNPNFDKSKVEAKFKKFSSDYFERGRGENNDSYLGDEDKGRFLRESGYDRFPVLVPRWETAGEDVYGTNSPGMISLGDIKQLQTTEKRVAQAIDKSVNPPMTGPTSMRSKKASILPGDLTLTDEREGQKGFRPAHEVKPQVGEAELKQQQVRSRIKRAFYEDIFFMFIDDTRRQPPTAREIHERKGEKLLALGPVLEQLNQDLLDPLIDLTFDEMLKRGMIPPPPPELRGQALKVEYVSVMAEAQKMAGLENIERTLGFVGELAKATEDPATWDKVDVDQAIDIYGDQTSTPPGIIRTDAQVAEIRRVRAEQQQAEQAIAAAREVSASAKDLAGADLEGDNALNRVLQAGGA